MPYKTLKDLPEWLHDTPKHMQEIFQSAFNSAFEQYKDEGKAFATANAAVKKKYEKNKEDKWVVISDHAEFFEGKWIPVFRTGTHIDSKGVERTWTDNDLSKIAASYAANQHGTPNEAAVVIGHPETNSPAYGWVDSLKKEGNLLYAKTKKLVPEFVEMVKQGLFKNRSISLRSDLSLRHIGFLGAMPPAVKGLPNIQFNDKDGITIEFCEHSNLISRIFQRLRDWLIEKEGSEKADAIINNFELEMLRQEVADSQLVKSYSEDKDMKIFDWLKGKAKEEGIVLDEPASPTSYSEGDMKKQIDEAVKAKEIQFAELQKKQEIGLKAREEALKAKEVEARKASINSFCEQLLKAGKLTPAVMKVGMGLQNFLEQIHQDETTIEFTEGDKKKSQTSYEFMQSFLANLPKAIEYKERAGKDNDIGKDDEKREGLIDSYMESHKNATYREAVLVISENHPTLFQSDRRE